MLTYEMCFLVPEGLESLLQATDCKEWLFAEEESSESMAGLDGIDVKTQQFPSLAWCLDANGTVPLSVPPDVCGLKT